MTKSHSFNYSISKKLPRKTQVFSLEDKCLCLVPIVAQHFRQPETPYEDPPEIPRNHLDNLLTYREPTRIYLTDACGRCQIPKEYWGRVYINLLEFCAELVLIWIDILEKTTDDEEFLLSMGDITTDIG